MEVSERTALMGMALNFFIFGIKYVSASASGSIALKAEAFHTLADFIASLTVFVGLKIAKRKTKAFPYGLYKIENLMSVVVALVIIYSGYEIVLEAINAGATELKNSPIAIVSLVIAIIATYVFSRYERRVGKKINSPILLADSAHIHTDVLSNAVVLIAIITSLIGYQLDKIAAFIVAGFIFKTGVQMFLNGIRVLLDASLDHETLSKVEKIILETPQVIELKKLTGRNSGRFKFIEADIVLKAYYLEKAHFIVDGIEDRIKDKIKNIDHILIHYEPLQKEETVYAFPLTEDKALINSHFGESPYFMLIKFKVGETIASEVDIINNPYIKIEKGKGILAAELLTQNLIDYIILKNDFNSKGPAYVFSNSNTAIVVVDERTPEEALERLGLGYDANTVVYKEKLIVEETKF